MRRVADALSVKAGALYWYFPNKQSLLAAVADEVLAPAPDLPHSPPPASLSVWAAELRDTLLVHRDSAELVASTRAMGLGGFAPSRRLERLLVDIVSSPDEVEVVGQAFMHFVLGHVMEEQTQSQLASLGVIASFDHDRSGRFFDRGVRLLVAGVQAGPATMPSVE